MPTIFNQIKKHGTICVRSFFFNRRMILFLESEIVAMLLFSGCQVSPNDSINQAPKPEAASIITATVGDKVVLDGSASFDPENDPLSYQWVQSDGPQTVDLQDADSPVASFIVPIEGIYIFYLNLTDGINSSKAPVEVRAERIASVTPPPTPAPTPTQTPIPTPTPTPVIEPLIQTVDTPQFSPADGTIFTGTLDVVITCGTSDAIIYYTLDGTVPNSTSGIVYVGPIHLTTPATIKAVACKSGMTDSSIVSVSYHKPAAVAEPVIQPNGATFQIDINVTITAEIGAIIYYTLDGTIPSATNGQIYTTSIHLTDSATLKAIACKNGMTDSAIVSAQFYRDLSYLTGTAKWQFPTGSAVNSSPAVGPDGTIYVGSDDGKLYAVNADGTAKWNFSIGVPVFSSPAIDSDGVIYVGAEDKNLYAVNPDGTEKWHLNLGQAVVSSPAVGGDGTIYVHVDGTVYAINPDGTTKWSAALDALTGSYSYSSPAIGGDGVIYVGSVDGKLYAINPDGSRKWTCTLDNYIQASPAVGLDGVVYVGTGSGTFYAVNSDGTEKWSFPTGGYIDSSAVVGPGGVLYVGSADFNLYAINSDGTLQWAFPTGSFVQCSPAVTYDGTILIGSTDGRLYAIRYDGSERWRFESGGPIGSSPTVGPDATIYIGSSDGNLYAVYSFAGGLSGCPWPQFRHDIRHSGRLGGQ